MLFTGEENGLLGSFGYARAHRAELDRHVAVIIHDIGDGRITGYYVNGRPDLEAPVQAALEPVASRGATEVADEAILGTDNFDFLLEGVPNLVANQDTSRYLADYHAQSDTYDKVDLDLARNNAAVAAVVVSAIANAPEAPRAAAVAGRGREDPGRSPLEARRTDEDIRHLGRLGNGSAGTAVTPSAHPRTPA